MLNTAWLFIGVVSVLITAGAILTPDDGWAILLGVAGFVSWGIFAYAALEITVPTDATTYQFTLPIVTMYGVIMSLIPGYIALTGPTEIVGRWRDADIDEI